jgi:hypothetical protein
MRINLQTFSFRFAEQGLNSKLILKQEIEYILLNPDIELPSLSCPHFNKVLENLFIQKGWETQPRVFNENQDPSVKLDFLKERIGIEVEFGHSSFIGIDLLKFQVSSCSSLDKIDIGVYIVSTHNFQKRMKKEFKQNWEGSSTFEKVKRYLPHFKSAIQVPIYVIGMNL